MSGRETGLADRRPVVLGQPLLELIGEIVGSAFPSARIVVGLVLVLEFRSQISRRHADANAQLRVFRRRRPDRRFSRPRTKPQHDLRHRETAPAHVHLNFRFFLVSTTVKSFLREASASERSLTEAWRAASSSATPLSSVWTNTLT